MSDLVRFSVSMESELGQRLDQLLANRNFGNRSEAIRDMVREALVRDEWADDVEVVGTITLVYDHQVRDLMERLTAIQYDHHQTILSTMHVHLDRHHSLSVIAVQGLATMVQMLSDSLIGLKGVKHGRLSATTTGAGLM